MSQKSQAVCLPSRRLLSGRTSRACYHLPLLVLAVSGFCAQVIQVSVLYFEYRTTTQVELDQHDLLVLHSIHLCIRHYDILDRKRLAAETGYHMPAIVDLDDAVAEESVLTLDQIFRYTPSPQEVTSACFFRSSNLTFGTRRSSGRGHYGRLGHGDERDVSSPKLVSALLEERVLSIDAGIDCSFAVCQSGPSTSLCLSLDLLTDSPVFLIPLQVTCTHGVRGTCTWGTRCRMRSRGMCWSRDGSAPRSWRARASTPSPSAPLTPSSSRPDSLDPLLLLLPSTAATDSSAEEDGLDSLVSLVSQIPREYAIFPGS